MADAVNTVVLHESKSDYVALFTNISDGTGESAVTKIDPALLSPACADIVIDEIIYATNGMAVRILADADTDVPLWVAPQEHSDKIKLKAGMFSGLPTQGTNKTGKILFTTVGHTTGDMYAIILKCRKKASGE